MDNLLLDLVKESGIVKIINGNVDDLHREDHRVKFQKTIDVINNIKYVGEGYMYIHNRRVHYHYYRRALEVPDALQTYVYRRKSASGSYACWGGTIILEYKNKGFKIDRSMHDPGF